MSIGERLQQARKALELSQDAIADSIGSKKRGYQENERGRSFPGGKVIEGFVRLGINANWLLTGQGPMMVSDLEPCSAVSQTSVLKEAAHLSTSQHQLVAQLIDELAAKPEPGFSADTVREMVITVHEIMREERMELSPEEVADAVVTCLHRAVRPDRGDVERELKGVG
ncbi:MAG: helix-turn-helix domain-containing protein [Marinobacterium sp.]|nr:helix-turn-helix domain-containing protein [Marinobacterium sp.]